MYKSISQKIIYIFENHNENGILVVIGMSKNNFSKVIFPHEQYKILECI